VLAVPLEQLARSQAPLSLVFQKVAGIGPGAISAIAIVATLNTVLVQMTMATRVMYGMAKNNDLPQPMARVNPTTATPLFSTVIVVLAVLFFALALPIEKLAEWTSLATLVVFAWVNLSLIALRRERAASGLIPKWFPVAGLVTCLLMLATAIF
jgi:amino acid transporter